MELSDSEFVLYIWYKYKKSSSLHALDLYLLGVLSLDRQCAKDFCAAESVSMEEI